MSSVFTKRIPFKPFEYPEAEEYKKAINHSYWLVSEWSFASDVDDFHVRMTPVEKSAIKNALLAISQVEVAVKKFWGRLGDHLPKPEFEQVGATFAESECFDEQTEILTENGWTLFSQLPDEARVAQYDIATGAISFVKPTNKVARRYKGEMHHYVGGHSDMMVTPNHEILVLHPTSSTFKKKKSSDGKWGRNYRYPVAGMAVCENPMTFGYLDRLLIAIQADGSLYGCCPSGEGRQDVSFTLKKARKIQRLKWILEQLGYEYTESARENGFVSINFRLPDEIDVKNIKSFGYIDLTKIDAAYGLAFLEEIKWWDSSCRNNSMIYYNTNEQAIDKVMAIAAMSGVCTNKGVNITAEDSIKKLLPDGSNKLSAKTVYALGITLSDLKIYPMRTLVEYDGMVYCVTVPTGAIVTRRNKRVAISGNCRHSDAYSHLLQVLGLNQDFEHVLTVPAIKGRVKYLADATKIGVTNEDFSNAMALFSLFVENVSLFGQFAVVKAVNKHRNFLKDTDNVIQATAKEEQVHALFGAYLVNKIREEHPSWFNEEFYAKIKKACLKAYKYESGIVDWIYENGELPYLTNAELKEFLKYRFNESMEMIGCEKLFEINSALLKSTQWFIEELLAESKIDFFHKRPVQYAKFSKPITADDLF